MKKSLYTLCLYTRFMVKVYETHLRYRRFMRELLHELNMERKDISKRKMKRIESYVYQSIIVASWVSALKRHKLTLHEKKRAFWIGVITPLLDDYTDHQRLTSTEIFQKLEQNEESENPDFKMGALLFHKLLDHEDQEYKNLFLQAMQAQDPSIRQLEKQKLPDEELEQISRGKGGLFTLLYWTVNNRSLATGEAEAVQTLGYALQQANDAFDVYKDSRNSQQTFFTNATDIQSSCRRYQATTDSIAEQFLALAYPNKNIRKCLMEISTILGIGAVCSHQLNELQKKSGDPFDVHQFSKKELLCEMEKPLNFYNCFRFSTHYYQKIQQHTARKS